MYVVMTTLLQQFTVDELFYPYLFNIHTLIALVTHVLPYIYENTRVGVSMPVNVFNASACVMFACVQFILKYIFPSGRQVWLLSLFSLIADDHLNPVHKWMLSLC